HWFEVGRTEMLREAGLTYARLERERGLRLTVIETGLQYHLPARYDDVLVIESRLTDVKRVRMRISTSIRNQTRNELLCTGHVWLACVTAEGRPCPLPEDVRELLTARSDGSRKMEHGGDVPRG